MAHNMIFTALIKRMLIIMCCVMSMCLIQESQYTKGAPKRVKNQNSNGKKYNKKPKKAQANLGLSNDGMESSLPRLRHEQAHTRNDASDNYKDTHECFQQIDEYETLEGHNGMKVNMDWMESYNLWTSDMHEYFAGQATQDGTIDTY